MNRLFNNDFKEMPEGWEYNFYGVYGAIRGENEDAEKMERPPLSSQSVKRSIDEIVLDPIEELFKGKNEAIEKLLREAGMSPSSEEEEVR